MNNKILNILKYVLGWPLSFVALIFIIKLITPQIPTFIANIHQINFVVLLYAFFSFLIYYFVRSYIWYILVRVHSDKINFRNSSYLWGISELKRYIPGSIIAFLGRAVLFSELGVPKKVTGKLLVVEAVTVILGAVLVSLLALPFIAEYLIPEIGPFMWMIVVLILLSVTFVLLSTKEVLNMFNKKDLLENAFYIFLNACGLLFFGLGNFFAITSFITLPIQLVFQLSGFFVLSLLLGYLSILTPAGFGVREATVILGLSKIISISTSALAAIFSRVTLILSELLFVGLSWILYKSKNNVLFGIEDKISKNKQIALLIGLITIYIIYISTASFLRFENFYAGRFDLGNMAQTVWNTTHGRIFQFTNPNGTSMISRLAFHADFLLILLAPIYSIFPNPTTLLYIQALVVAAGSIFVFLITKNVLKNKNLALTLGTSYLLNPSIQRANLYDFHPVTLATTFLLGMYYFYLKKKYVWFCIFAFLGAISKEQIWLIVALFGLLLFFHHKKRIMGGLLFVFSTSMFYYLVSIAIPEALGSSHFALSYYSDLGDSPVSIIKTIIFSPQKIIGAIFKPEQIHYLVQIFSPVGYLVIFSPFYMIFAVPDLLINLLSNNSQLHQIYYQYTAAISPFIFICTIYGIKNILKFIPRIKTGFFIIYILVYAFVTSYLYGPLPGAKESNIDMFTKQVEDRQFIIDYLSHIPKQKSVATSNNIGSHLSDRQRIYTLPLGIDKADVIVFFLNDSESPQSISVEREQLRRIRNDKNYQVAVMKGKFVAFIKKQNKL